VKRNYLPAYRKWFRNRLDCALLGERPSGVTTMTSPALNLGREEPKVIRHPRQSPVNEGRREHLADGIFDSSTHT
jgi:hypothetical protein